MMDKETLMKDMTRIVKETDAFAPADLAWFELILRRNDGQQGIPQLAPFVQKCLKFLKDTKDMEPFEKNLHELDLQQALFTVKSLFYKQKKIVVAVPQRKRHPVHVAPNLGGFIAPQSYRIEVDTCYGLGYVSSREYFVKKALEPGSGISHILFVDDDILLPLNSIERLVSANEMVVGCGYVKRNPLLECVATTPAPDPKFGFANIIVPQIKDDYSLVPVNATGLGATLVDVDVFRTLPYPWFEFVHETLPNGEKGRLLVGEDSRFVQKLLEIGMTPKIIPGLVALHVDFRSGDTFGPEWLVDPLKRRVRPEYVSQYCHFTCDTKELYAPDNDTIFGGIK